jgi:hypothetical protein
MASKKILIQVDVTTKSAEVQINKVVDSMKRLEGATVKQSVATKKLKTDTGLNNAILLETGRLASDASYGFGAIANNLGQLITLFQSSAKASGGVTKALGRLFRIQSLFIIAIQLLISFLPKIIKRFQDKAKAARAVKDALIEGTQAVQGQVKALESYQEMLNSNNLSLTEKQKLLDKVAKEQKLENLELDENNNLSEKSNKLIKDKIRLLVLESQANTIKSQIQEELTKRAKALAQVEEDVNSQISKGTDFVDRNTKGLQNNVKVGFSAVKSIVNNTDAFAGLKKAIGLVSAPFKAYNDDVNSAEAIQSRRNKADAESNKITKESENRLNVLIEKFKSLTTEMLSLTDANEQLKESQIDEGLFERIERDNIKLQNITAKYNAKSIEDDFARKDAELKAEEQYQIDAINSTEAYETEKERARLAVQTFYAKQRQDNREKEADAIKASQLSIISIYAKAIGTMGKLFKQGSDASKAAALTEIAINTGIGYVQGLDIAQKSAKGTGPLAAFAFPVFYAQQVLAVLGAAAQAKQILASGGKSTPSSSVSGTGAPTTIQAPDFNVVGAGGVSQLATTLAGVTGQPIKAFVVSKEISSAQELERNITTTASIG